MRRINHRRSKKAIYGKQSLMWSANIIPSGKEGEMNELRNYQIAIINAILDKKKLAVWAECGLGKTRCVIEAMSLLFNPRTLVVAPKMVCETTWKQEFEKWNSDTKVIVIAGSAEKRKLLANMEADVYIISRDNVDWYYKTFGEIKFDLVVLDESTSFKNVSSKRWKAIRHYTKLAERVIELTGTPASNGLIDLFGQMFLLDNGQRLGTSISRYREKYFTGPAIGGYQIYNKILPGSEEIILNKVRDITYALQAKDYLELPPRIDNIIPLNLSGSLAKKYEFMKKNYVFANNITASNAAVLVGKLAQLANGFVYDDNKNTVDFSRHKVEYMQEVIDTATDNILIFAMFQRDISELKKLGAVELNSSQAIQNWQEGKIKVAVAYPASIGYGINLQSGGHVVFWYSLPWSLELYDQSNARLYRQGQTHPVIINHLITSGTVEEQIYEALQRKSLTQEVLMRACKLHLGGNAYDKYKKF